MFLSGNDPNGKGIPYLEEGLLTIKANDHNIHVFPGHNSGSYETEVLINEYHWRFSLHDIISKDMNKFYLQQSKCLISGYIKESQETLKLRYNVPVYISQIVLRYFPLFL